MNGTKEKIISAAIKVFSKNPSASMEEIAETISLSRRTLHRHFSGKSELISEIISYASSLCLIKTKESIQSTINPINQLKAMFLSDIESGYQFSFLYKYKDTYQNMEEESSDYREMMEMFRDNLKALKVNNLIMPQLTLEWIEKLYLSIINVAINLIIKDQSKKEEIVRMAWISYSNAIILHSENNLNNQKI